MALHVTTLLAGRRILSGIGKRCEQMFNSRRDHYHQMDGLDPRCGPVDSSPWQLRTSSSVTTDSCYALPGTSGDVNTFGAFTLMIYTNEKS
jgi:hypothetical protein